ncbi:MAG: hypothetical protein MJY93_01280 [Fibrobacter sp.]|nr:hypothetical protein [Fibrobacter sp.]
MKKNLSILELQNSIWPEQLKTALGKNMISAFVHGDCLMEGYNAMEKPWTVSFILRDNSNQSLEVLRKLLPKAKKDNLEFRYFFTLKEIQTSEDVYPLEFLHIASRNEIIAGQQPLPGYKPSMEKLRLECERELRGFLIRLRQAFIYLKEDRNPLGFFVRANETMLPIMYGVYYLQHGIYPECHQQIFNDFPALQMPASSRDEKLFLECVNNYISTVTEIVNLVDTMEVK